AIGCDLLSTTGRKYLRAPRGTGFLYVRRGVNEQLEPPFLDMHAARWVTKDRFEILPDARRFENWEMFYAGKIGLGVAIDYALGWGLEAIWTRVRYLGDLLRSSLLNLGFIDVHDLGAVRCGIGTFTVQGIDSEEVKRVLAESRINVSVSGKEIRHLDEERPTIAMQRRFKLSGERIESAPINVVVVTNIKRSAWIRRPTKKKLTFSV